MAVVLQDLYGLVSHKQMALIAGKKGMNRPVRWLHMVESVDIASFLEGDEIAFVTGIGLKQPGVKAVPELVRAIYDHGASAIVLNVGPYIPAIPESVQAFCDDVALPLFQVPWDVHMAELMHIFSTEITERERLERDMQQAFETAVMKPVPAEPYLSVFSKYGFRPELPYRLLVLCPGREAAKTQTDWLEKVRFSLDHRMKHGLFPGESCLWLLTTCCDTGTIQQRAEQWPAWSVLVIASMAFLLYQLRMNRRYWLCGYSDARGMHCSSMMNWGRIRSCLIRRTLPSWSAFADVFYIKRRNMTASMIVRSWRS